MRNTYKLVLGIDPGKGGGLAIIEKNGNANAARFPLEIENLPFMVEAFIEGYAASDILVMIEHVHSFPTDSRPSAFSFGRNLGQWEGVLYTNELTIKKVPPKTWQKFYDIPKLKDKYKRKRWLKEKAKELFPNVKVTLATGDALLIANYANEQYNKKKGRKWEEQ